jgi:hypothetical protein
MTETPKRSVSAPAAVAPGAPQRSSNTARPEMFEPIPSRPKPRRLIPRTLFESKSSSSSMDEGSGDDNDLTLRPRQQAKDFFAQSGWTTESAKTSFSSPPMKCKKCAPWDIQASVTVCTECTDTNLANKFQKIAV